MKEAVKGYHIFLSKSWLKWAIYIPYPIVLIGMVYLLNRYLTFFQYICIGLVCGMIVVVEIMIDTYVLMGIASKNTNRLEYLKTSTKGLPLLKKVLAMDAVRRFLSITVILAGAYLVIGTDPTGTSNITPAQCFICIEITDLLVELALLLTRLFLNVWINLITVYVLWGIAFLEGFIILYEISLLPILLVIVLCAGAIAAGRTLILKRAGESYYDR